MGKGGGSTLTETQQTSVCCCHRKQTQQLCFTWCVRALWRKAEHAKKSSISQMAQVGEDRRRTYLNHSIIVLPLESQVLESSLYSSMDFANRFFSTPRHGALNFLGLFFAQH